MTHVVTLAIDLGTSMGFAIARQDGRIESGTLSLNRKAKDHEAERFVRLRKWFTETHAANPHLSRVVYERVHHVGMNQAYASQLWGAYHAILLMFCYHHNIEHEGYQLNAIKKQWTGRGDAKKEEMIGRARALGFKPESSDEADAIALLHVAMKTAPAILEPKRPRLKPSTDTRSSLLDILPARPF